MNPEVLQWLASDNGQVVHITVFMLLVVGGLGFPVPEDIPILLGGVAAANNIVSYQSIFLICYLGVMLGDQIMFFIGHRYGQRILSAGTKSPFFPSITEDKVNEVREGLRKRRLLYIFIARHLFPIRSVTFVVAGALHIPFVEFFIADAFAAFISVGVMVGLGALLGETLSAETITHLAKQAHYYIIGIVVLLALGYLMNKRIHAIFAKRNIEAHPTALQDKPTKDKLTRIK